MDLWLTLPVELIIRILCVAAEDDPDTLLKFAQTSKRNHRIAADDTAWLLVLSDIFHKHSSPSTKVDSATLSRYRNRILPNAVDRRFIFRDFYLRLIAPHRWLLGWWVIEAFGIGCRSLYHVYLQANLDDPRKEFCLITGHKVFSSFEIRHLAEPITHPNVTYQRDLQRPDGFYMVDLSDQQVFIYGNNPARFTQPNRFTYADLGITIDSHRRCLNHNGEPIVYPVQHRKPAWNEDDRRPSFELFKGRSLERDVSFGDAPFPSPSALPVVRGVLYDLNTSIPTVPETSFDFAFPMGVRSRQQSSIPIYPPSHFANKDDHLECVILSDGIYTTNGAEGQRFAYIRMRELGPEDFKETWAWDGTFASCGDRAQSSAHSAVDWSDPDVHLGPFSRVRCMSMDTRFGTLVDNDYVKEGARIIEVVKLAGSGAPAGQRITVAFLDDPRVIPEGLRGGRLARSHVDVNRDGGLELPWPLSSNVLSNPSLPPTANSLFQRIFNPERGIDIPAVARIARRGFVNPSWIDVIMHVESKDQFSVFWRELDYVEIWTKM